MHPASTTHGANVVSITTARGYTAPAARPWLTIRQEDIAALQHAPAFELRGPTPCGGWLFRACATAALAT